MNGAWMRLAFVRDGLKLVNLPALSEVSFPKMRCVLITPACVARVGP